MSRISIHRTLRLGFRSLGIACVLAAAGMTQAGSAWAYALFKTSSCNPGQKWDISRPVQVRLLADSYFDYLEDRGGASSFADLTRIDADIKAVIALYNGVPGSGLVLEQGVGITGDRNLEEPEDDNFGTQTIVIGFTDEVHSSSSAAEAWAPGDPKDGCTRTRAHILFRKDVNWIFGPPDTTDVDGRHFTTVDQPRGTGTLQHTFLGILTHEMGHAIGLGHPVDDYAVMAQNFRTWFRGPDHVLRTGLLPDDIAGLLALYGTFNARTHLDISVTNSWYKGREDRAGECTSEIAEVDAAAQAISDATGLPVDGQFPAHVIKKGSYAALFDDLENAQNALQGCEQKKTAMQLDNCFVSSRGDSWVDRLKAGVSCGVNDRVGSSYPKADEKVCPGGYVQLRYTLNNHSMFRDALVKTQVWFSPDTTLNVRQGNDHKSPDVREFTIQPGKSNTIGQMFRLPSNAPEGQKLWVFVRAVPYDSHTGNSLWKSDAERWNNAIMLRSAITATSAACS